MKYSLLSTGILSATLLALSGCTGNTTQEAQAPKVKTVANPAAMAAAIRPTVNAIVDSGLTLDLWGVDSLVADPVSIDIDDAGNLYYTRTNRQKHSEFDIRAHQDWEIESIRLETIEEKRAFLHRILSPENSNKNTWLADLNGDGSHDWRDMTLEKEHIYQLSDTDGDGTADESRLLVDDFHTEVTDAAGGILRHEGDLFVAIGPDLWKYTVNKQGAAVNPQSLSHGYGIHIGFSGHGMSGIEVGPEGKVYWQIGDIGFSGKDQQGKLWHHPFSGVIVRANPDGSDFEVFSYGNRNTHEFTFDEYGNLLSEDNDGDHAGESERLVYVVNGADIGWRTHWQFGKYKDPSNNGYNVWMDEKLYIPRFKGQAAYITPTIKNFVNGPTGFVYNPGTALDARWKNHFFVAEFVGNPTRSGVHAFTLKPSGAGFEFGQSTMILKGVLATGLDFGPDGSLYVGDWIDGWGTKDYGRMWKLSSRSPHPAQAAVKALLAADLSATDTETLAQQLTHEDMRVRQHAQFELARRGESGVLQAVAKSNTNQFARIHAIWGLRQLMQKNSDLGKTLVGLLTDSDPEIRAQAAKWLGDARYKPAGAELVKLLKDQYARAQFFGAEALGRIAYEAATSDLIDLIRRNNDEDLYIRHAASLALARLEHAEPLLALANDPSPAVRLGAVLALRRLKHPGLAAFLKDKDEAIATEAARAINDDESVPDALAALGDALNDLRFTSEPLLRRAINANLRVGTPAAMSNLMNYAKRDDRPLAMRTEALAALSTWAHPSVTDRVDGRYRGEITRDAQVAGKQVSADLIKLSIHRSPVLRVQAIKALAKLQWGDAAQGIQQLLRKDPDADVRAAALQALVALGKASESDFNQGLNDATRSVRVVALEAVNKSGLTADQLVKLLMPVITSKTTEEQQTALETLGQLRGPSVQASLETLVTQLEQHKLPAELYLELASAVDSTRSAALIARYQKVAAGMSSDTLKATYAVSLAGGNPRRGAEIFYGHQSAQCLRCHSYGDYGGTAGPRLNGVGSRLTREQLLEALINPSARIAPGFGTVSLKLKDGTSVNGVLTEERAADLKVKVGDQPERVISKDNITARTDGASSMPPMRFLLTKKEIRDVVSFLATLQ